MKRHGLAGGIGLAVLLFIGLTVSATGDVALALQATDVVRRKPPTTPTSTPVPIVVGWRGQVLSNTPYATLGNGSIVRVHVLERVGEPISLARFDITLSGLRVLHGCCWLRP